MLLNFLARIFGGNKSGRVIRKIEPLVLDINILEPKYQAMSDEELRGQTEIFKNRLAGGETLDDLLIEAFAVVREAGRRSLNMRHFDCQLIGGVALHTGSIAEMKTGEGKTLVSTLPAYLNALTGRGVHIVTVNDYLAKRDSAWMGKLYNYLGMSVGVIVHGMDDQQRKAAYAADITYGTNNEFGFDYLRDNMKYYHQNLVLRDLHYAIVDEVDSILIDEARTPLIISGPTGKSTGLYTDIDSIISFLKKDVDYTLDEKARTVSLTEDGISKAEELLKIENLYDPRNIETIHHLNQALRAHSLFKRDVDYIVKDGEVVIVDEFTGRLMPGRRFGEGLHQALEAKEGVKIAQENQTYASTAFQNFFRMYDKLAGMTGTALTEAEEFKKIYKLDVICIPPNMPMIRTDLPDVIYKTKKEKYDAVVEEIIVRTKTGQPVLVGTVNIDVSEYISSLLVKKGVRHSVLNAKHHEKEAEIIAMAGQKDTVTISTNMAGRGTDIVLGPGVVELGGLHIIGTERHESRRIDNQLRGRAGRQGDPGSSKFYLSLEDDLLRIFGGDRITAIMEKMGLQDGEPIEHNMISRAIENAQKKVEGHNFDIRKYLLEYDDVMNQQRNLIYSQRRQILTDPELEPFVESMIEERAVRIVADHVNDDDPRHWNLEGLKDAINAQFNFVIDFTESSPKSREDLEDFITESAIHIYREKADKVGPEFNNIQRFVMLESIDGLWKDHLLRMDHLKEGIGLRGYAQENPLIVYKKEGFAMFQEMVSHISEELLMFLFRMQIRPQQAEGDGSFEDMHQPEEQRLIYSRGSDSDDEKKNTPVKRDHDKIGRNDLCPCGSGKKYKKCCG
ncbi:preprotein translocase subunit SecA [Desulforegula conservatrix]|uniref:preprotein translocase subunit SecA n=1 Tax=Desulforegula conservatrix TaxID=153026 RepID=UPI000425F81A|nr:preprotein translocase subunit SecA [Desulforegula conservatrix]